MTLTAKLIGITFALVIAVEIVDSTLFMQRQMEEHTANVEKGLLLLGKTLTSLVSDVAKRSSEIEARGLIQSTHGDTLEIRWWEGELPTESNRILSGDGKNLLSVVIPFEDKAMSGGLEILEPLTGVEQFKSDMIFRTLRMVLIILSISAMLIMFHAYYLLGRPLSLLGKKIQRTGSGDFSTPVILKGSSELVTLAKGINEMCERLSRLKLQMEERNDEKINILDQLRRKDRLSVLGRLSSGMAHELGTPLQVIMGRASQLMRPELSSEERIRYADVIHQQSERMSALIRQLLDYGRGKKVQKTPISLGEVLQDSVQLLSPMLKKNNVQFELAQQEDMDDIAWVEKSQMQQLFTNIIINAMHSMFQGGKIRAHMERKLSMEPGRENREVSQVICVHICDEGDGIATEILDKIFDPFFSTKDTGQGTGLGLSICFGIVRDHGGWIEVESQLGQGSTFSLNIPRSLP